MPGRRHLNPAERAVILLRYENAVPVQDIADEVEVDPSTIRRVVRQAGVLRRAPWRPGRSVPAEQRSGPAVS
jgi:Helix-turn-helix domain